MPQPKTSRMGVLAAALVTLAVAAGMIHLGLHRETYPLFHLLAEFFAISVAVATFMIAWSSRKRVESGYLVFLGIAYFFVAAIDLVHAVSYRGINLIPGTDTDLPTQLWIAARYLQAIALVMAPAYLERRVNAKWVFWGFAGASLALVLMIFWGFFPVCFDETTGLTTFKKASEFIIAGLMAVGLGLLWRKRAAVDPLVLRLMSGSIALCIVAELAFTGYANDPFGAFNMAGHLLRIVAYYLLYLALVKTTLERPAETLFRELTRTADALRDSEARYRSTFEQATLGIAHVSFDGHWIMTNPRLTQITGYSADALDELRLTDLTYPNDRETEQRLFDKIVNNEIDHYRLEKRIVRKNGSLVWVNATTTRLVSFEGDQGYLVYIIEDITERKDAELMKSRGRDLSDALTLIDRTVLASLETDVILQRVLEDASAALNADAAAVIELIGTEATIRRVHRLNPVLLGESVPAAPDGPSMQAQAIGEPVWIKDLSEAPDLTREWLESQGFRSTLFVPLHFRDAQIGSITFLFHQPPLHSGDAEFEFAAKLSAIISVAMENARLYSAEREIADVLQTSLIGTPPEVPGLDIAQAYYSATELTKIGGDFYDVFTVAPGKTVFVLGDVAGKGLEAATITAMAKSTIRAFAYRDPDPAAIMRAANDAVTEQIDDGRFITAILGIIDVATGKTSIVCAGHPSPIRCGGPVCAEEPIERNLPLGIYEDQEYDVYDTVLDPGDVFVLFSDGLIDARHGADLLGEERVREVLTGMGYDATPNSVVEKLLDTARTHSAGSPPDDITILALRYLGPPRGKESPMESTTRGHDG